MNVIAPDLSHYYGRRVVKIEQYPPSVNDPTWALVLEGDVVVQNYDETLPVPGQHIVGQVFSNTTLAGKVTSMFFGGLDGNTVSLNPMKYAIASASTERPYFPQISEAQKNWQPPPQDLDRLADRPDNED